VRRNRAQLKNCCRVHKNKFASARS
jgi:hypothetical protein